MRTWMGEEANAAGERFIRGDGAGGRGDGESEEEEEEMATDLSADWSSWMAVLHAVVHLFFCFASVGGSASCVGISGYVCGVSKTREAETM